MLNIGVAFKILDTGETPPPGYRKSSGHMIYSIKMDWGVKDGHRTPDTEFSSYAGVFQGEEFEFF